MSDAKDFVELLPSDFDKFPIWEEDPQDFLFRPVKGRSTIIPGDVIRMNVTLADGTDIAGIAVAVDDEPIAIEGLLFFTNGKWIYAPPCRDQKYAHRPGRSISHKDFAETLGRTLEQVYPIHVESAAVFASTGRRFTMTIF
jgi:hypothetical protein